MVVLLIQREDGTFVAYGTSSDCQLVAVFSLFCKAESLKLEQLEFYFEGRLLMGADRLVDLIPDIKSKQEVWLNVRMLRPPAPSPPPSSTSRLPPQPAAKDDDDDSETDDELLLLPPPSRPPQRSVTEQMQDVAAARKLHHDKQKQSQGPSAPSPHDSARGDSSLLGVPSPHDDSARGAPSSSASSSSSSSSSAGPPSRPPPIRPSDLRPLSNRVPLQEPGSDGKFRIIRNALGVPGLHIALNVCQKTLADRLHGSPLFSDDAEEWVIVNNSHGHDDGKPLPTPLQRAMFSPGQTWPVDLYKLFNVVRDCGLFPQAVVPDSAYALTYLEGSQFPLHWDSRSKWGEFVVSASFGAASELSFQHVPNKESPYDKEYRAPYTSDDLPVGQYAIAEVDGIFARHEYLEMLGKRYTVTMKLPPNSVYVMSGAARVDWRHGVSSLGGTPPRKCVIYRSTKVYSQVCLRMELASATARRDAAKSGTFEWRELDRVVDALQERIDKANQYTTECPGTFVKKTVKHRDGTETVTDVPLLLRKEDKLLQKGIKRGKIVDQTALTIREFAAAAVFEKIVTDPLHSHHKRFRPQEVRFPVTLRGLVYAPADPFADFVGGVDDDTIMEQVGWGKADMQWCADSPEKQQQDQLNMAIQMSLQEDDGQLKKKAKI